MIYRSKAPLRISLAGGGTDVSPYCDMHGGAIINSSVSLFAYATIQPILENAIIINAMDRRQEQRFEWSEQLPLDGTLDLVKGTYNMIQREFGLPLTGFSLSTFVDAPPGSGLGSSSTLVVAVIGAFVEMLRLPLGNYDIAYLAYRVEREYLGMAGGRQDQFAAAFGGVNFMEFTKGEQVIVNPLHIKPNYLQELENNLLLYYTATSRDSGKLIEKQQQNVVDGSIVPIEAMHQLKRQAQWMKEALLKGRLQDIGEILDFGFEQKRKMADGISTPMLEQIYDTAKRNGAIGGKISGAGGGGYMIFYCPEVSKYRVMESLNRFGGYFQPYQFTTYGLTTWTV